MSGEEMHGEMSGEMSEMSGELELLECCSWGDNRATEAGN